MMTDTEAELHMVIMRSSSLTCRAPASAAGYPGAAGAGMRVALAFDSPSTTECTMRVLGPSYAFKLGRLPMDTK
jgi:hypothetical protein